MKNELGMLDCGFIYFISAAAMKSGPTACTYRLMIQREMNTELFSSLSHPRLRSIPEHKEYKGNKGNKETMEKPRIIEKGLVISITFPVFRK